MGDRKRCGELSGKLNVKGEPCGAYPLKGSDRCAAHTIEPGSARFGTPEQAREAGRLGGRPPKPRIVDVLRERVEGEIDEWLKPLLEARAATRHVVVGNGPTAHVEEVPDIPTRLAAAREVMDRTHGKAKQVTEITGEDGGPVVMTFAEIVAAADAEE